MLAAFLQMRLRQIVAKYHMLPPDQLSFWPFHRVCLAGGAVSKLDRTDTIESEDGESEVGYREETYYKRLLSRWILWRMIDPTRFVAIPASVYRNEDMLPGT
jgi:hypothetical protein